MVPYINKPFTKTRLKQFLAWSLDQFGQAKTVALIERLKSTGYAYATRAGISLGIDDLLIPRQKSAYLHRVTTELEQDENDVDRAYLASSQYFSRVVDVWTHANTVIKNELVHGFQQSDNLNPVYMMAFSGARGNVSQVRQLVGMRGLMADPNGQIIDFVIQSNFREGLSLTEYMIACYGSRKGVVDTALRTATSGYLTRRLVDVAQHVVIAVHACNSRKGLNLASLDHGGQPMLSLKARLIGRVLSHNITTAHVNMRRNQELDEACADALQHSVRVSVRSALTCALSDGVCQLCYGWNLARGRLVSLGETVGVIAAQSIGEPGTQLTMRTFHTGGVFAGDASREIRGHCSGRVDFPYSLPGLCVKTDRGQVAFLTKGPGLVALRTPKTTQTLILPSHCLIYVKTRTNGSKECIDW